jgi:HD superfamily phosphohydrolase
MASKRQRVRDPVHNLIEFRDNEFEQVLWGVVQTRAFQRLRRIKQLGFSDLVFPGATHSRYAHSLGVFHTARMLMEIVKNQLPGSRYRDSHAEAALAAALVHDLGHGPFSHVFEEVSERLEWRTAKHEDVSRALITEGEVADQLNRLGSGSPMVPSRIGGNSPMAISGDVGGNILGLHDREKRTFSV